MSFAFALLSSPVAFISGFMCDRLKIYLGLCAYNEIVSIFPTTLPRPVHYWMWTSAGTLVKAGETSNIYLRGSHHVYLVLVGLFSSITGGVSYCLIRAGAKASDQPV